MNSLRCSLEEFNIADNFNVYTFDIIEKSNGFKNICFDLSQDEIVKAFKKLIKNKIIAKPDYIVSSSLCQSFSLAMQSISNLKDDNGNFLSGNPHRYWDKQTQKVKNWPNDVYWNGFCGNSYPLGSNQVPKFINELGSRCIENTIKLIQYFRPKVWYIENPAKSLIWKYIKYNLNFTAGYENLAHYSAYNDNFSRKPTIFLSNVKMNLKKISNGKLSIKKIDNNNFCLILSGACKNNYKDELKRQRAKNKIEKELGYQINLKLLYKKNSMARSKIPPELLFDILHFFSKHNKDTFLEKNYNSSFSLTPWTSNPKTLLEMVKEMTI